MKRVLLITTLLTLSPMAIADDDSKRANTVMKKLMMDKVKEKVLHPVSKEVIRRVKLIGEKNKDITPSVALKSLGALIKTVEKVIEPTVEIKTKDTKLRIKLLKFKNLKLNYKNKNQNLDLKFETDLETTKLGFSLNF